MSEKGRNDAHDPVQPASTALTSVGMRTRRQPRKDYRAMVNSPFDGSDDEGDPDGGSCDDPDNSGTDGSSVRDDEPPRRPRRQCASSACVFTCVLCFADADDKTTHLDHLASAHPNLKTHCLACESQYTYSDYTRHLRDCHPQVLEAVEKAGSENRLYCLECGKGFDKKSYLYQHRSQHFMLSRVPCAVCGKSFLEGAMMNRHMATHKEQKYECSRCTRTFRTSVCLKRHERVHARYKHLCQVCGCLFSTVLGLEIHMCMHHKKSGDQYCCSLCQKECSGPEHLRHHMMAKHGGETGGERVYICQICDRRFRWKQSLNAHIALHNAENGEASTTVAKCDKCGRKYRNLCALKAHLITHSNLRQFPCDTCGISFKRKHALKEHSQAVHCSEKKFQCSFCGQTFVVKRYLTTHVKQAHAPDPQPFTCSDCPKVFKTRKAMRSHWRTCHGDVPKDHICELCHKAFVSAKDLRRHSLTHGGDRVHKCEHCGASFYRADNLQRHVKSTCKLRDL
ncbi:uncharacterized protein LOC144110521 [Amblyomma americanum]